MKKNVLFSVYIGILILFFACAINITGCSQRERIIKIGSQSVLTGDYKNYGQEQLVSMNIAAKELAPVRIAGFDYKISIVSKDDEGNAEKSYLVSQEMIQENVSGVIGSSFNAATKAALSIYQEYDIPMITPSAAGNDLEKTGSNFFRIIITR